MIIRQLRTSNFRCLESVDVTFERVTSLVGANGAGKSTILHALAWYFGEQPFDPRDPYGEDQTREVRVALTLSQLDKKQREQVRPWLADDGTLTLARVAKLVDGRWQTFFESTRLQMPEFAAVRQAGSAAEAKLQYRTLREDEKFRSLPAWTSRPAANSALDGWEEENRKLLVPVTDRYLGIGPGSGKDLSEWFRFVLVPAVHDVSTEGAEGRSSAFRRLLDVLIKDRSKILTPIQRVREDAESRYNKLISAKGARVLSDAAKDITARLNNLAPGAAVNLTWTTPSVRIDSPTIEAELVEGGFPTQIGRQGHGVQRAYLMAVLQALAEGPKTGGPKPLVLLAIEEPELYLHPVRAGFLNSVLQRYADSAYVQIMYTTHSPYFVSIEDVESVRLLRATTERGHPSTVVAHVDLDAAAKEIQGPVNAGSAWTAITLRPRLKAVMDTRVSEGFFANRVILVEGAEDRAFLVAAARRASINIAAEGTSIVVVQGKYNLDKPLVLFRQLGIPVYVLFDGDVDKAATDDATKHIEANRRLLRLLGSEEEDFPNTTLDSRFACFARNFAHEVASEFGNEAFGDELAAARDEFGFVGKSDGRKNTVIIERVLEGLGQKSLRSPVLEEVLLLATNSEPQREGIRPSGSEVPG